MFESSKLVFLNFIFLATTVHICHTEPAPPPRLSLYSPEDPEYTAVLVKRVGDNLTLTCEVKGDRTPRLFVWDIVAANGSTTQRHYATNQATLSESSMLIKSDLQLEDSGQYICSSPPFSSTKLVLVQNRGNCARDMFSCGERCVRPAYVCDGRADCADGLDEQPPACPGAICQRQDMRNCSSGRCIPAAACCAPGAMPCQQPSCCLEHAPYNSLGEGHADPAPPPRLSLYSPEDPEYIEVLVKRVGDNLTLTCEVKGDRTPRLFVWDIVAANGSTTQRHYAMDQAILSDSSKLMKSDLQLEDSGRYICSSPPFSSTKFVLVQNRGNCARGAFPCSERCVLPQYVCDGHADCADGLDEQPPVCLGAPCQRQDMLNCSSGRCIPAAACCAPGDTLCLQPSCCLEHAPFNLGEGSNFSSHPQNQSLDERKPLDDNISHPQHQSDCGARSVASLGQVPGEGSRLCTENLLVKAVMRSAQAAEKQAESEMRTAFAAEKQAEAVMRTTLAAEKHAEAVMRTALAAEKQAEAVQQGVAQGECLLRDLLAILGGNHRLTP